MDSAQPHSEASMIRAGQNTANQAADAPVYSAAVGAGVALTICVLGVVQPAWRVLFLILVLLVVFVIPVPSGGCAGVHLRYRAQVNIAAARLPDPPRNLVRWDTVAKKCLGERANLSNFHCNMPGRLASWHCSGATIAQDENKGEDYRPRILGGCTKACGPGWLAWCSTLLWPRHIPADPPRHHLIARGLLVDELKQPLPAFPV